MTESAAEPCSCLRTANVVGRVAVYDLIDQLACIVGRIRGHLPDDSHCAYLALRAGFLVECLDTMVHPCAAEIYQANLAFGADEHEAVEAALEDVDRKSAVLARLLAGHCHQIREAM